MNDEPMFYWVVCDPYGYWAASGRWGEPGPRYFLRAEPVAPFHTFKDAVDCARQLNRMADE